MDKEIILLPLFAQVLLTAVVWFYMYYTRIREIIRGGINPQELAHAPRARELLKNVAGPSENLINLFEMPVLFYVAVIAVYMVGVVGIAYIVLAWLYVVLRVVHSIIHVTYDKVVHRFAVYVASSLVLWVFWGVFAFEIFNRI